MRTSGINALSKHNETDDYIEYTIKIPKENKDKIVLNQWALNKNFHSETDEKTEKITIGF